MSEIFLKLMPTQITTQFITKYPKAFTLLYFIAQRTNRITGEAQIGDYEAMNLSRQEYRTALKFLTSEQPQINQQITIKTTNKGTFAKLISKAIIDINLDEGNQQSNQTSTTKQPLTKNKELRIINKKEIYKEKEETFNPYWDTFKGICVTKNIEIDMTKKRYLELRDEYYTKLNWFNDSKACVEWCYDKGLRKINIQRLRNWMKNALKFQKEKEIKQQQYFQDKKFAQKPQKIPPVWEPPIEEIPDSEIREILLEDQIY